MMVTILSSVEDVLEVFNGLSGGFDPTDRRFLFNVRTFAEAVGGKNFIRKAHSLPKSAYEQTIYNDFNLRVNRELAYYVDSKRYYIAPMHLVGQTKHVAGYMILTPNMKFLRELHDMNKNKGTEFRVCVAYNCVRKIDNSAIWMIARELFGLQDSNVQREFVKFMGGE